MTANEYLNGYGIDDLRERYAQSALKRDQAIKSGKSDIYKKAHSECLRLAVAIHSMLIEESEAV
jgi:hypothetical protein